MTTILVVNHSDRAKEAIKTVLEKSGHVVNAVESADLAINTLKRMKHDLVLLDMHLNGKDGLSCLAGIRADPAILATPVFMISETIPKETILKLAKLGVSALILKNGNWALDLFERVSKFFAAPAIATPSTPTQNKAPTASPAATPSPAAVSSPTNSVTKQATSFTAAVPPAPAAPKKALPRRRKGALTDEAAAHQLGELTPIISRSQLLETLQADTVQLRCLRPVVEEVLRFSQGSDTSVQSLASIIRKDPALSLLVMRLANSADLESASHADTVLKAVARIGLDQIFAVIKTVPTVDAFNGTAIDGWFRPDWFWEHSFVCGTLALHIAEALHRPREYCDAIFTAGLLHDIGRLLLIEHLRDQHSRVISAFDDLELPLELIEARLLLHSHAEVAEKVMRSWNFSPAQILTLSCHQLPLQNISSTAPRGVDDIVPLALANRLAHCLLLGTSGNEVLYPIEEFVDHLNLPGQALAEIIKKVRLEIAETRIRMLTGGTECDTYLDAMRDQLGKACPLPLALRPEVDPVSIMLNAIRGGEPVTHPNLITLRICNSKDRAAAAKLIEQAIANTPEGEPSRENLPILVIGDNKSCLLNAALIGNRNVQQVILPRALSRLFCDMNDLARR